MSTPNWILENAVLAVHQLLIAEHGGADGLRDPALLDSALNRARQRYHYEKDSSIFQLAACYAYGLVNNHPFADGNKRIALTVAAMFLECNGYSLDAPEPETVLVMQDLAAGKLEEQALAEWLKEHSASRAIKS